MEISPEFTHTGMAAHSLSRQLPAIGASVTLVSEVTGSRVGSTAGDCPNWMTLQEGQAGALSPPFQLPTTHLPCQGLGVNWLLPHSW